jgi:hypothetical protein
MRENAATKARRLLAEGRLIVTRVDGRDVSAIVRGDSAGIYSVTHRSGSWACDCPTLGRCSHVQALMLVTVPVGRVILAGDLDGRRRRLRASRRYLNRDGECNPVTLVSFDPQCTGDSETGPTGAGAHRVKRTPVLEVEARVRRVHPGEVGDDSDHDGDPDYEPADACHRPSCDPADQSTTHQPDQRPDGDRKRAGLPPEDLIVGAEAPTFDPWTHEQHVVLQHVDESDDGPEDRSDDDEDPGAARHGGKRSGKAGLDRNDPEGEH